MGGGGGGRRRLQNGGGVRWGERGRLGRAGEQRLSLSLNVGERGRLLVL